MTRKARRVPMSPETMLRIKNFVFDASITANSIADHDGVIIEANAAFLRIWGYTNKHEVVGKPIPHFLNDPTEAAAILSTLNGTGRWEGEYTAKRMDGSTFIANGLASVVRDENGQVIGYQSVVMDCTERKQAEQAMRDWNQALEHWVAKRTHELQQSETRFRQLADAPFDGIAISEHGILIDGNAQLGQLHGYELSEMIGRPASDFIAPESRKLVAANLRNSSAIAYEFFGLRKDGSIFPIEARGRMGIWQGKTRRISALRDLSDIRQTAARLQAQQCELEHAQRLAMASEISAGIVHQVGQPLCAMGANVGAALVRIHACELKNCGTHEILKDVEADIGRMRDAVIQLRALIHPEQPTRLRRNFNEMVEDVLRLIRQEAGSRQIALAVELGDDLPPVLADAGQLSHAILNLVRNAFDACAGCPPERRTVSIMTRAVADQGVELCVRDAGTGIASEAMAGLFTPFFTTKSDGLGIGLRLSRTIVAAHGGLIEGLNNDDGIGATFRITLPAIPE
jgi:PAS domain S-box-containing protein